MGVIHVQRVVPAIAGGRLVLIDIAELRMGPEQLALRNRGPVEATTAGGDDSKERVGNLVEQCRPHGEVFWIQLIEIQAARQYVDAVIPHVGEVDHIVRRGRVLEPIHPLLVIVGLAIRRDRAGVETDVGQSARRISDHWHKSARKRILQHAAWARTHAISRGNIRRFGSIPLYHRHSRVLAWEEDPIPSPHHQLRHYLISKSDSRCEVFEICIVLAPAGRNWQTQLHPYNSGPPQ